MSTFFGKKDEAKDVEKGEEAESKADAPKDKNADNAGKKDDGDDKNSVC
jgi:hypothetical protein